MFSGKSLWTRIFSPKPFQKQSWTYTEDNLLSRTWRTYIASYICPCNVTLMVNIMCQLGCMCRLCTIKLIYIIFQPTNSTGDHSIFIVKNKNFLHKLRLLKITSKGICSLIKMVLKNFRTLMAYKNSLSLLSWSGVIYKITYTHAQVFEVLVAK